MMEEIGKNLKQILKNSTLNIIFEEPFIPRRGRINCSLKR